MSDKALFIPLNREHFEAFERGDKHEEYRLAGGRWNERTCAIGRSVVLSLGYGKQRRLVGEVLGFRISDEPCGTKAWKDIYGDQRPAACIRIEVIGASP